MNIFNNLAVALDFVVGDATSVSYDAAFAALSSFEYGGYNDDGEWSEYAYSDQQVRDYLDYMKV